jgi:hypothetical protein
MYGRLDLSTSRLYCIPEIGWRRGVPVVLAGGAGSRGNAPQRESAARGMMPPARSGDARHGKRADDGERH